MNQMKKIALAAALVAGAVGMAQAATEVLSFETLSNQTGYTLLTGLNDSATSSGNNSTVANAQLYGGFTWTGMSIYGEARALARPIRASYVASSYTNSTASTGIGALMAANGVAAVAAEIFGNYVGTIASNGTQAVFTSNNTFADAVGGFTLNSLSLYTSKNNTVVTITGTKVDGALTTAWVSPDAQKISGSTASYSFDPLVFSHLKAVTIFTSQGDVVFDNISVSSVSAVPEPGSYALLLAGLGVVGLIARRRR